MHEPIRRLEIARQIVGYRALREAIRGLMKVHEPVRRFVSSLPPEVRKESFPPIPARGENTYFYPALQSYRPGAGNGNFVEFGCGSGLFWLFQIKGLDVRYVDEEFELAAQDLECLLGVREPTGEILLHYASAGVSRSGSLAGPANEPLDMSIPEWITRQIPARKEIVELQEDVPAQGNPKPKPQRPRRRRVNPQKQAMDLLWP